MGSSTRVIKISSAKISLSHFIFWQENDKTLYYFFEIQTVSLFFQNITVQVRLQSNLTWQYNSMLYRLVYWLHMIYATIERVNSMLLNLFLYPARAGALFEFWENKKGTTLLVIKTNKTVPIFLWIFLVWKTAPFLKKTLSKRAPAYNPAKWRQHSGSNLC